MSDRSSNAHGLDIGHGMRRCCTTVARRRTWSPWWRSLQGSRSPSSWRSSCPQTKGQPRRGDHQAQPDHRRAGCLPRDRGVQTAAQLNRPGFGGDSTHPLRFIVTFGCDAYAPWRSLAPHTHQALTLPTNECWRFDGIKMHRTSRPRRCLDPSTTVARTGSGQPRPAPPKLIPPWMSRARTTWPPTAPVI